MKRAKELGDYLIVAVSSDEFNKLKGKETVVDFEDRKEIIKSIKYVDQVIDENCWEQKESDLKKFGIDVFVMGDDWKGKFDFLSEFAEVVYLERTPNISTSSIKLRLNKNEK